MSLNATPSGERTHIAFFGCRNAGKSSLINAVTGHELSVVSDIAGTTTDPVYKAMEILPLGPCMMIDTPGFDDRGELGELRVKRTRQVLNKTDIAVLVADAAAGITDTDKELLRLFKEKELAHIIVYNKSDLLTAIPEAGEGEIYVSAKTGYNINELRLLLGRFAPKEEDSPICRDLVSAGDIAVLVAPIDSAAPKGRLILPQQQTIRDLLDAGASALVLKDDMLKSGLEKLVSPPKMVITDSQVFPKAADATPEEVPLTSFSILMARHKGFLETAVLGVTAIERLCDGDTVLVAEGCTHHRQCEDIGTVKIPRWLREYTGKELKIESTGGGSFPDDLSPYSLVIHCGGCMLSSREVKYRMKCSVDAGVPFTNYGTAIAYLNGILERSLSVFPELLGKYREMKEKNSAGK